MPHQPDSHVHIVFSRRPTFSSRLLRAFLWSEWSHCGLLVDGHVYEATALHGVVCRPLEAFLEGTSASSSHQISVTLEQKAHLVRRATSQLNKRYDWFGALGIAFHRDWDDEDLWFCSEYVAWIFQGVKPLLRKPKWRVTPPDLFQIILQ